MADTRYDIAFGIGEGYVPHLGAAIASIVRCTPDARIRFIILHDGIPLPRQAKIEAIAPDAEFVWTHIIDGDVPDFADHGHFNRTTLFRFQLERLAPADCKRAIYLDADLIVMRDLRELFAIDLGQAALGAAVDAGAAIDRIIVPSKFAQRWGLSPRYSYFNAGVLLLDLERIRSERMFSEAERFLAQHQRDLPFNDQDALNWRFWGLWAGLPPAWNVQYDMVVPWLARDLPDELRVHSQQPALVHFTGPGKPWTPGFYHPWSWIYWQNLARTPFLNEVAARAGITGFGRLRMWLRWVRRRPRSSFIFAQSPLSARSA